MISYADLDKLDKLQPVWITDQPVLPGSIANLPKLSPPLQPQQPPSTQTQTQNNNQTNKAKIPPPIHLSQQSPQQQSQHLSLNTPTSPTSPMQQHQQQPGYRINLPQNPRSLHPSPLNRRLINRTNNSISPPHRNNFGQNRINNNNFNNNSNSNFNHHQTTTNSNFMHNNNRQNMNNNNNNRNNVTMPIIDPGSFNNNGINGPIPTNLSLSSPQNTNTILNPQRMYSPSPQQRTAIVPAPFSSHSTLSIQSRSPLTSQRNTIIMLNWHIIF